MLLLPAILTGLLLFVCGAHAQIVFGCSKDVCNAANCPDIADQCYNSREIRNASKCGCCHICVKPIEKGQNCELALMATTPRWECGSSLMCIKKTGEETGSCQPANTACTKALDEFTLEVDGVELTQGKPKPKCDHLGFFQPVQCKPGMMCYCTNKNGDRIFGTAPYTDEEEKNMDCNCSRVLDHLISLNAITPDDARYFLRCASNGNYDGPQCTDSECYCINTRGEITTQPIRTTTGKIDTLSCYDSKRHSPSFMTPCLRELEKWETSLRNMSDYDLTVVGLDRPYCDPDGTYAPKQCQGKDCYCVNKNGVIYQGGSKTRVPRYSEEAKNVRCNCRREKELIKNLADNKVTQIFAGYKCLPNGNYLPMQCTSSICVCVDENGFQSHSKNLDQTGNNPMSGETVDNQKPEVGLVSERHYLRCYKKEYDDLLDFLN